MKDKIEYVDEGRIDGVLMSSAKAYHFYKMVERGLSIYLANISPTMLEDISSRRYVEALESKIEQAKRVALKYEHNQ